MIGIPQTISKETATTLYYLLYSHYGNSTIASSDINRFKYQLFSIIYMYGPTWEKRLELQNKLRNLTEEELFTGSTQIYNHSFNPSTAPSTSTLEELTTINEQNTQKNKRDKLTAYGNLMNLLEKDVTKEFIDKFKKLFLTIVQPEAPLWYVSEEEDLSGTMDYIKCYSGSLYGNFRQITFSDAYSTAEEFIADYEAK